MGEIFANPLTELAEYGDMKQDLMKGKGPVQICGVTDSQKVHVMYQVSEEKAWRISCDSRRYQGQGALR